MIVQVFRLLLVYALIGCTVANPVIVPSEYLVPNERFLSVPSERVTEDIKTCQYTASMKVDEPKPQNPLLAIILIGSGIVGLASTAEYGYKENTHQHPAANGVLLIGAVSLLVLATVVGAAMYLHTSNE